jgi:outer membrane protein assembly factor BamB
MSKVLRGAAALAGTLVIAATAGASDWPTFAGSPLRLFFNPAETQVTGANVTTLRVKWKFHTGAVITASPSVAVIDLPTEGPTQVVFIQSWDGNLYAIRLRDGTEVWHISLPYNSGVTYPNVGSADVSTVGGVPHVHVVLRGRCGRRTPRMVFRSRERHDVPARSW